MLDTSKNLVLDTIQIKPAANLFITFDGALIS